MNKYIVILACMMTLMTLAGCADIEKEARTTINIIEHKVHEGEFQGEVQVYAINFMEDTFEYEGFHPVYKQNGGTYVISYDGEDCLLKHMDAPMVLPGCEYSKVRWKIDSCHFVEGIPRP